MAFDYEKLRREISWDLAKKELGYKDGDPINLSYVCVDRNVEQGRGEKLALVHENHEGEIRNYTYRDLQLLTNGWADFLVKQGIEPADRVCIFLDRLPELYIGFMGVLKLGAVVQPLFSAFGEESVWQRADDSKAVAVITQHKHLGKMRKIRDRLPELKHVIVVDHDDDEEAAARGGGRGRLRHGGPPGPRVPDLQDLRREPERAALHQRHDREAEGGAPRPLEHLRAVPDAARSSST